MKKFLPTLILTSLVSNYAFGGSLRDGEVIKLGSGTTVDVYDLTCRNSGGIASNTPPVIAGHNIEKFNTYLESKDINPYIITDKKYNELYAKWKCSTRQAVVGGLRATSITVSIIGACTANAAVTFTGIGLQMASFVVDMVPCRSRYEDIADMNRRRIEKLEKKFKKKTCAALHKKRVKCEP